MSTQKLFEQVAVLAGAEVKSNQVSDFANLPKMENSDREPLLGETRPRFALKFFFHNIIKSAFL
jgi:hypothetical protein